MKRILITCLAFCTFISCKKNFLDQTTVSNLDENSTFADSANSMAFLADIYTSVGLSFNPARFNNAAGLEAASDEAQGPAIASSNVFTQFITASVNPYTIATDPSSDAWSNCYTKIRAVNQFLYHSRLDDRSRRDTVPLPSFLKIRTQGEAMFLRAWYYSLLLKHYGGVPLIGDAVYAYGDDINTVRNNYSDCVEYIVSQCDSAVNMVDAVYTGRDYGRVTKGACLALKAKVLLYAASPLFNGGQIATDEPLHSLTGYPTYDRERWKRAADAAKMVIDLPNGIGGYALVVNNSKPGLGFYNVFLTRKNSEYIFAQMRSGDTFLEGLWRPPSRGGGNTAGSWPYQNLVDAFQMRSNGLDITDPNSGYDPQNPYANRDPRLDFTVTRNESIIKVTFVSFEPVYTYVGEPNGDGFGQGTPTGYYGNKMCQDDVVPNWIQAADGRNFPLIRLADVLLMYAEALNEYNGAPTQEVYDAVNKVRARAAMPNLPAGLTYQTMQEAIRHEREVELAFEEQRFWDVRRWKIAPETEAKTMTGMKITRNADSTYSYTVVPVREHQFKDNEYLFPIPQSETAKSADLIQNTGY